MDLDNVTTLLQIPACTVRLLKKPEELFAWAHMKIKPTINSCSLSIQRVTRNDSVVFTLGGETI